MSEFHYVRTMGTEGGVSAVEGPAVGLDLETILKDGLPPFKITLEIISALCEIIDIADQDSESHGEVLPRYVFLDETGAVSLEGYGAKRTKTTAPERSPKGAPTDQWGLGYCAFRLMSPADLPPSLPDEAQAYDDAIIDAIVGINLSGLPDEIQGDIQWFVAKLMSFEKEDRPTAVDVWRTFLAFADTVTGPRLDEWATAALGGGGERRDKEAAAQKPEPPKPAAGASGEPDEDLGGPVMQSGPLAKGGLSFDGGGKKGQATAFWSREDMKKALEEDDEDSTARKPKTGGGAATNFWSHDQMKAMSEGKADAPRPKRKENGGNRAATQMMRPPKREDEEPDLDRPAQGKAAAPPKKAPPPPPGPPPVNQGGQKPAQQQSQQPAMLPPPQQPPPAEGGGGPPVGLIVGVLLLLLFVVGGGGLVLVMFGGGGILYAQSAASEAEAKAEEARQAAADEAEEKRQKEEREEKDRLRKEALEKKRLEDEAKGDSKSSTKKPTTKTTTTTTTTTTIKPTTKTTTPTKVPTKTPSVKPKPVEAAPTGGPAVVKLKSAGRGKLACSDGQGPSFDGLATLEVDPYTLPVSCMVTIDGKKGAFQVASSSTITCNINGSEVTCG